MPDAARLDPRWWKQNRPECLSKSAVEKPLNDFVKISRSLEKSGNVTHYFKAVSTLKSAIAKDQQTAKKAKDKEAIKLLSDLERLAHEQTKEREGHLTLKSDLVVKGLSGTSGVKVEARPGSNTAVEIVNGGDSRWQIIKDNAPVGSAKNKSCQAVPKRVPERTLEGWNTETADWTCTLKNERNVVAVTLNFHLQYRWNGQSTESGGVFLTDCKVWADANVQWGYTVNVEAAVQGRPFNSGSRDAPVGAIRLGVSVSVATPLKTSTKRWTIICHGNKKRDVK